MATKTTKSKFAGMDKEELIAEAERQGLTVVRRDGQDGDPTKDDFLAALDGAVLKMQDAHGNQPNLDQSAKAPGWTPAAIGKPVAGQPGTYRRPRRETEDERDERLEDNAKRTVRVRATRAGEYPTGTLRDIGAEFDFVVPEDAEEKANEADVEYKIPSWLEAIDEDGEVDDEYPTREVGELSVAARAAKAESEEDR